MYNFKANEDILPLSEFRSNLAGYITQTRETGRPIIVTQNGRTAGVFVNASTWDETHPHTLMNIRTPKQL